ncbi:MAG: imidazole glycerol phosphate synthase subunit HisH [Acidobacteriota bacterium]|nr:imidazole glycerol phosphate synthase subunit HisH [Acidobacteriota bacterium]
MIALLDYGAGNLTSVRKALAHLGAPVTTPPSAAQLADASGLVVPGVGHFEVTATLGPDWRDAILSYVSSGRPLLGICVGMQWLFDGSAEAPGHPGLGLIPGTCQLLTNDPESTPTGTISGDTGTTRFKVPHVGWNALHRQGESWLLDGINEGDQVYFTHSYAAPLTDRCVGSTCYGTEFAAAVEYGPVGGVQFHPEKSSDVGLKILRNFLCRVP